METSRKEKIEKAFRDEYNAAARLFRAPGRVNIIGEHTDYNNGFVLPFAIDRDSAAAAAPRQDRKIRCRALDLNESVEFDLDAPPGTRRGDWVDYIEGTARSLHDKFHFAAGADVAFSSNVPVGAGLSSSAAIEISFGLALLSVNDIKVDKRALAFAAQEAEHKYVGTQSGIMDQFASIFGKRDNAMLLDCRSLEIRQIPLAFEDSIFVACDTKVKHSLASSEYNTRRQECERAVELLREWLPGIRSLRDIGSVDLERYGRELPETIRRRVAHVVTENERTVRAAESFAEGDLETAGRLMYESHESLRKDYEVSCRELDVLVEIARSVDGVFGARMTGGGFGGCTVNLIKKDALENFKTKILKEYNDAFHQEPAIFLFHAVDGAFEAGT
jgi:galactokinase